VSCSFVDIWKRAIAQGAPAAAYADLHLKAFEAHFAEDCP
jgi:hypothetical protein